jgi:dipeptidyl aminopeptidase/acylaminoacyl peptidase
MGGRLMRAWAICCGFVCAFAVHGMRSYAAEMAEGARRSPTNEDLRHLPLLQSPSLSPDGTRVLFAMIEGSDSGGRSHLWLTGIDPAHGAPRQLTTLPVGADVAGDDDGEAAGAWLPNGQGIIFLAKRDGHRAIVHLALSGGEASSYTLRLEPLGLESKLAETQPTDVTGFAVSPDGKTLAVIADDPTSAAETERYKQKDDPIWVDHEAHRKRLVLLDLDEAGAPLGSPRSVPIADDVTGVSWGPSSDSLLAMSRAPNNAVGNLPVDEVWLVARAAPGQVRRLTDLPTTVDAVALAPDSKWIAFTAQSAADAPPGLDDLYLYSVADRTMRNLSAGSPGTIIEPRVSEYMTESLEQRAPIFTLDGKTILLEVQLGVKVVVARFDLTGGYRSVLRSVVPVTTAFSSNRSQSGWVYLGGSSTLTAHPYFQRKLTGDPRPLEVPASLTVPFGVTTSTEFTWHNDGFALDGVLYMPPSSGHPVPLVVDVHGGPLGAWVDNFDPLAQLLVARGWAVFHPNPRGSTGQSAALAAANKDDLGGGDLRDILTGVDEVLKRYPIDSNKLALIGYSYGGEIAGFAEGKTNRFKTIVSGAPVIDQYSEYGTEGGDAWYDRWYFGKPWERPADAWRQSPLATVTSAAKTPFLLLQGELDTSDPLGQSQEMYRALRQEGVEAQLVIYPRETHVTLRRGLYGHPTVEPWHGFDARTHLLSALEAAFTGQ